MGRVELGFPRRGVSSSCLPQPYKPSAGGREAKATTPRAGGRAGGGTDGGNPASGNVVERLRWCREVIRRATSGRGGP